MAEKFDIVHSRGLALPQDDIDTDIIFPARFLLITEKRGLGRYAFYEWRFGANGAPLAQSPFPASDFNDARILVAGANFGCGSSREHAVWTLKDLGIRAILAPNFGEIFRTNCFNNGVLAVTLPLELIAELTGQAAAGAALTVDLLERQIVDANGALHSFEIEDWRRQALLEGWDEIDTIRNRYAGVIADFEREQRNRMPWLWNKEDIDG